MKVAFAIWDGPLLYLTRQTPGLFKRLLSRLLESLASRSAVTPGMDMEKEAILEWILHLLFDGKLVVAASAMHSTRSSKHNLLVDSIEFCLTHSCVWTKRLGELLLKNGDDSFRSDWSAYFAENDGTTVDDRVEDVEMQDTTHDTARDQVTGKRTWNLYDGVWTPRPIGIL